MTQQHDTEKILMGFEAVVRRLDAIDKRLSLFEQFFATFLNLLKF